MAARISGLAVAYTTAGFVLLWSGYKNATLRDTLTSLAAGKVPAGNPTGAPEIGIATTGSAASSTAAAGTTDSAIANNALRYVGHCYKFGGAPGPDGKGCWDCSSACNWWLGHDGGLTLPGASSPGYNGATHGPDTLLYLAWSGASTIGHTADAAQAGDLCVWQTHMGIAIGGGEMVSALNPSLGTKVTPISGPEGGAPPGELLFVRRLRSFPTPSTAPPQPLGVL